MAAPADEELQQLNAAPARAGPKTNRVVIACVAFLSSALLFRVTSQPPTCKTSNAVLAAREQVRMQLSAKGGPHAPGDADTDHAVDSCSDPCIPCDPATPVAGSYSSFPSLIQHLMAYNMEVSPYGGVIFTDRGQYGAAHQDDPYSYETMVATVLDQYDALLENCLSADPTEGADTCSHYYVNACALDQSSKDSQVSCVEACVTERFAATMKGTIDDVSVCAYPVSSTFLLAPNVVKSCLSADYDASEGGAYDVDSGCYDCITGCMEAQGGVDAWVINCPER
jgi:hypothetical protein